MKRIYDIIAASVLMISAASCSFLEVEKIGKSDIETYFSEVSALEPAMNGIYSLMFSFYDRYFLPYTEVASDEVALSASSGDIWVDYHNFATTSDYETSALGYMWKGGYEIINNTNQVIYWAPRLKGKYPHDHALIDNVTAAALFVRALMHFDLCRVYGQNYTYTPDASHLGIAIRDRIPSLSETISRSSVKKVYQQITDDLELALKTYDNCTYDAFRPGPLACKALLARVYLYMGKWSLAEQYASEVIDSKSLTPADEYMAMFCDPDELGEEAIYRLNGYEQTTSLNAMFYYQAPVARPTGTLMGLFDDQDIRKNMFSYSYDGKDYESVMLKYTCTKEVESETQRYYNLPLLRLSEMYLIRAEAYCRLNESGKAEADLKELVARATGKDAASVTLDATKSIDELVSIERQKELCFEGHRFFDIARRHEDIVREAGTTSSVRKLEYPDNRFVLQIPYVEIDANDMMQQNPL